MLWRKKLSSEKNFLGLILKEQDLFEKVYKIGNIFTLSECRKIFVACMLLYESGIEITPTTIVTKCNVTQSKIFEYMTIADNREHFDIKFDFLRKELAANNILKVIKDKYEIKDYNEFIDKIEYAIGMHNDLEDNNFSTLKEIHGEHLKYEPEKDLKIKTGFSYLDKYGGVFKKNLTIIGARPKTGKSSLMVHLMRNAMDNEYRIGCFSMEVPKLALESKLLANYLNYSSSRIYDKNYDADISYKIGEIMEKTKFNKCWIGDKRLTLNQIVRQIRFLKKEYNIDIIFIDHLHFIKDFSKMNSIDKLAMMVNTLAELKNELNITIFLLAQLNRESESNPREPKKSDLKGCGDIEQAGDSIWLLYERELIDDFRCYMDIFIINRYGVSGKLHTIFHKDYSSFEQIVNN